jgi:hypothetical protein
MLLAHMIFTLFSRFGLVAASMQMAFPRFNLYLALLALLLACGCRTAEERRSARLESTLRLHLSARSNDTELREPVQIAGVTIFVERAFFLDETSVEEAEVLDTPDGGFAIRVAFNASGRLKLESVTASNPGRQIVIFSHFGDTKGTRAAWLAAPRIPRRISDGVLVFSPSLSREAAEEIVQGLNNVTKRLSRPLSW